MTMIRAVVIWYIVLNVTMFASMGVDKHKATRHKWRIPEVTLIAIAYLGGFIGSFCGMYLFHHKTKKWHFHFHFVVAAIIHIVFIYFIIKNFTIGGI